LIALVVVLVVVVALWVITMVMVAGGRVVGDGPPNLVIPVEE